jgi:hypothetical protein
VRAAACPEQERSEQGGQGQADAEGQAPSPPPLRAPRHPRPLSHPAVILSRGGPEMTHHLGILTPSACHFP